MTRRAGALDVFPEPAYSPSLLTGLLLPGQPGFSIQAPGMGQLQRTPAVSVVNTSTQPVSTATNTLLIIPAPTSDPWGLRTSTTQLTIPKGWDGWWQLWANVSWPAGTDATRRLVAFTINGAGLFGTVTGPALATAGLATNSTPSMLLKLAGGDLVTVTGRQDSAGTLTIAIGGYTLAAAFITPG